MSTSYNAISVDDQRRLHAAVLAEMGHPLARGASVLDFGCGEGRMVDSYLAEGYDAYGCDICLATPTDRLRSISARPYRLPFESQTFDLVVSDQVFEHVRDYETALSEIRRVMSVGAIGLHMFPARLRPIEPHTFVPFGGLIQSQRWLGIWASLGIRNRFQRDLPADEVIRLNHDYLRSHTNYLATSGLRAAFESHFDDVRFVEELVLRFAFGRSRVLAGPAQRLPIIVWLYRIFHMRAVYLRKQAL